MGEEVSQIEISAENSQPEIRESIDLRREFSVQYRLLRKKISSFIRSRLKKNFVNILYITPENPPAEFILALQKQYPDKNVKVMVPLSEETADFEKTSIKFDYFLQNTIHTSVLYKIPAGYDNVQVYGIYTEAFKNIEHEQDIYDIKYMSHFSKIARKAALKLKPDIIHAENVPLLMGLEFDDRWLSGYPIKYIQVIHNYDMFKGVEPFWAAINLANKNEMKKICNDNLIKKHLASIFKVEPSENKTKAYINYIYKKYDEYRQLVTLEEQTRENILLERMNDRILKLFPKMSVKNERLYNPAYYSMKYAASRAIHFESANKPVWAETLNDVIKLPLKSISDDYGKMRHPFDAENFREVRLLNKKYLVRELSEKRIEMKFYDINLFGEEDIKIRGYLDSFFKAPLFFISVNEFTSTQDIKASALAVLKAFELRKNIQVIYNYPKDLKNSYLDSLLEFYESQSALNGKWIAIAGKINMPQFLSASDMILIPSGNCFKVEDILYKSLNYGCIPVIGNDGFSGIEVSDIFDDMNNGCVFKADRHSGEEDDDYETLLIKALEFYTNNTASWNLIIKNAISHENRWDFASIEEYNNLYEELI